MRSLMTQRSGLEISWMSIPRHPTAREGTWIEKRLEARFNVDFKPLFTSHFAYMRRRPLVFAGGNVPDLFYAGDPVVVQKDAYHGYALPIPYEVIQKHAPNYVRYLNQYAPSTWLYAYWKGANYGIPTWGSSLGYPVPGIWRMDWLRNVGIDKVPATLDEMYAALWKFRHEDPDGNGDTGHLRHVSQRAGLVQCLRRDLRGLRNCAARLDAARR